MVIGVTGGYCAGKDAAARILARHGIIEINEDEIGHEALQALKGPIIEAFGVSILRGDGAIDRRVLGSVVFSHLEALKRLEDIVHPWMVEETRKRIAAAGSTHVEVNAAILHRMGLHLLCDVVLIIDAPLPVRFLRARKRDGLSIRETVKRLRIQRKQRQNAGTRKQFLNEKGVNVDTVIVNNGGTQFALARRLEALLSELGITGR
ncbi:MAG: dephospho-CoA kinase [Spirochaetales bacterium]|nr:dephospho-CoA kinase [Spirochaetales bacterium]